MSLNTIYVLGFSLPSCFPTKNEGDEVWSLNAGYSLPWMEMDGIDVWFEMHRLDKLYGDKYAKTHIPWLKEKHPFPIYMVDRFESFPSSVKYPLEEVSDALVGKSIVRWGEPDPQSYYFSCSFAYMLALAIYKKPKRITLLGVEMLAPREAYMEAPGVEFWLGQAIARGIEVRLCSQSRLLWRHLYGYEKRRPPNWLPVDIAREIVLDSQQIEWEEGIPSFYTREKMPGHKVDSGGVK